LFNLSDGISVSPQDLEIYLSILFQVIQIAFDIENKETLINILEESQLYESVNNLIYSEEKRISEISSVFIHNIDQLNLLK
jgi:hypothetical protein